MRALCVSQRGWSKSEVRRGEAATVNASVCSLLSIYLYLWLHTNMLSGCDENENVVCGVSSERPRRRSRSVFSHSLQPPVC